MGNLILLFITEIIIFLIAFLVSQRDILAPSSTVSAMFVLGTAFALANAEKWGIEYSFEAYLIISSGLLVFLLTEIIVKMRFGRKIDANSVSYSDEVVNLEMRTWVVFVLIFFDLLVSLWYFREVRRIVGNVASIGAMFARYRNLGVDNLAGRTTEVVSGAINQFLKIVKASGYIGIFMLFHSVLFEQKYNSLGKRTLLVTLVITSLIPNIMVASRGGILMFISNALIVYYILWHQKQGWDRNLSWRVVRYGILGLIIGIPVFYYSAFLMGRRNTLNVLDYVATYIGGPTQLFNLYVQSPSKASYFGEESLVGVRKIFQIIGWGQASTSYNLESRLLGNIPSNVYTFFRRPLHDFGLIGMYIFTMLISMLFCTIYYSKIKNVIRFRNTDIWVLIYGYLFYWLILSPIDQYSQSYISVGALITILIIVILFELFTRVRIVFHSGNT